MAYVKHDRTKSTSEARVGDKDTIYYTTDRHSIVINGHTYGEKWTYISKDELTELIKTKQLEVGTSYCIQGFVSEPNTELGLNTAGHKIDLTVKAVSSDLLEKNAYASYNTDGTDSFYEDRGIPVQEWKIEVTINGSELGLAIGMSTSLKEPTSLYIGKLKAVAHDGIDTLIAVYSYSNLIAVSKDGGTTFYNITLPYTYEEVQGIQYGNGTFVIYDEEGHLCVSSDKGDSWTQLTPYPYSDLYQLSGAYSSYASGFCSACYGNGKFYIIGNVVGMKSADGLTWEPFDWGAYDSGWYRPSVAAGDGIIGIAAYYGNLLWSFDDGATWLDRSPAMNYWIGIGFGNHTFSATAGNKRGCIVPNADTITEVTWPSGTYSGGINTSFNQPGKISYNNGYFYCFDAYNEVKGYAYSSDGLSWNQATFPKSMYPSGPGHHKVAFGPNGEMYVADATSNSIWVNPTPTQSSTWSALSPTGIDQYQSTISAGDLSIVVPKENSSYYLSYGGAIYTAYKFPLNMGSAGVVYMDDEFKTILYNYTTQKTFYSTSKNGVTWTLSEFPYSTSTPCQSVILVDSGLLCMFDGGQMYWIENDNIVPITYSGTVYTKSHIIYNKNYSSCIYAAKNTAVSSVYKLTVSDNAASSSPIALTQSMVITHIATVGSVVYVSGHKSGNTSTTYTDMIDLKTNTVSPMSISGYLVSSVVDKSRIIACTSENILIILEGSSIVTIDGVLVSGIYSNLDNILCQIVGNDHLNVLSYTIQHTLQISKLVDEFGNACMFDFKNIVKTDTDINRYFFDKNGTDYSLTGNVQRCKLLVETPLISDTYLEITSKLQDVTINGLTRGVFTFPNGGKYIQISDLKRNCSFAGLNSVMNNSHSKWITSNQNVITVSDLNVIEQYVSSDGGATWTTISELDPYATQDFVTSQGYLTEHQDISGKVDVTDFEKATLVTSAALNKLNQNLLWNSEQVYVKCDKTKTQEEALIGDPSVIYFTTDTNCIITNGQQFGAVAKVIDNDSITQMVLGTTSLKEAYLAPFDEDTSNQLNDIIYGTDTNID